MIIQTTVCADSGDDRHRTTATTHPLHGTVRVPGDKSITHRAILFGLLAAGETTVDGWLDAADCRSSISVARQLGADVEIRGSSLSIRGTGGQLHAPEDVLDCGNSGTTMRMFTGALAARVPFACVSGDASLRKRPMQRILQPLREMGADVHIGSNGTAPFAIRGTNLQGIEYTLPVASAQVKSAVLIAGCLAAKETTVVVERTASRDHTENMLPAFGATMRRMSLEGGGYRIEVNPNQTLQGTHVVVPGDMSSAAFLLAAAALVPGSSVSVLDVGLNKGRTGILNVLKRMGAKVEIANERIMAGEPIGDVTVSHHQLLATDILPDEVPAIVDEIPLIAVLAAFAEGETVIHGAEELRVKETDRIHATVAGLRAIGVDAQELPDGMRIRGQSSVQGGKIDSFHDHRIAMSFAVAGLLTKHPIHIENWSCVAISFPTFLDVMDEVRR